MRKWVFSTALAFIFITALLSLFQNCGNVNLQRSEKADLSSVFKNPDDIVFISPKVDRDQTYRAIMLFDMSTSMSLGPCPNDADTFLAGVNPVPDCKLPSGTDIEGKRFQIALRWIESLEREVASGQLKPDQVLVNVKFFTGGEAQDLLEQVFNRSYANRGILIERLMSERIDTPFLKLANAKILIYSLWAIQHLYINTNVFVTNTSEIPQSVLDTIKSMKLAQNKNGTSIPAPAMSIINSQVLTELAKLRTSDRSRNSRFEMIYFSDGVPKPHPIHIEKIIDFIWTVKNKVKDRCGYNDVFTIDLKRCKKDCAVYRKTMSETGTYEIDDSDRSGARCRENPGYNCQTCMDAIDRFDEDLGSSGSSTFKETVIPRWGDWTLNTHAYIFQKINTLLAIFKSQYPESRLKLSFIRLDSVTNAFKVSGPELDPNINWINRAKLLYKKHKHSSVVTAAVPYKLFSESSTQANYKLGAIFAVNLNYRVGAAGKIEIDSDADGLSDEAELKLGFDPKKARSDGKCLDSIKQKFGNCVELGCDPTIDEDQDGLNQCEERTLGTDDQNFDTDGDGIPDGLEVLFGLNPNAYDANFDSNSDGITNTEQFKAGVKPNVLFRSVAAAKKVNLSVKFKGQVLQTDELKRNILVPGYTIKLENMPLVKTLAVSQSLDMFTNSLKSVADQLQIYLTGGRHAANTNHILILIRIDNSDNPTEKQWMYIDSTQSVGAPQAIEIKYPNFRVLRTE